MEKPTDEIREVVKSITQPHDASEIARNVDIYFTDDAYIEHPMLNQPPGTGKEGLKNIYTMLRCLTMGNRIEFHSVAWGKSDKKDDRRAFIELTEHLRLRFFPWPVLHLRFIVLIDVRHCADGLYRISRQEDNLPTDLWRAGLYLPGFSEVGHVFKGLLGYGTILTGKIVTMTGLLG